MKTINYLLFILFLSGFTGLQAQDYLGKYHEIYPFSEGKSAVMKNGQWGFINEKGDEVVALKYESVSNYSDGMVSFSRNELKGYLDASGREVIQAIYKVAHDFKNGKAVVSKNDIYGVIDKSGKTVIPFEYNSIRQSDNYFVVYKDKKAGVLNAQGKTVIPIKYKNIRGPQNGVLMAENDEKMFAMLTVDGKELTPFKYTFVSWTPTEGLWHVQTGPNQQGFLDLKGKEVISPNDFVNVNSFGMDPNYIIAGKSIQPGQIRYGIIDRTGKTVIPFEYKFLGKPSEGLVSAMFENDKYGFIDLKGKTVIEPVYDIAFSFTKGRAQVGTFLHGVGNTLTAFLNSEYKYGVIDRNGKEIIPLKYADLYLSNSDYIAVNVGKHINSDYSIYTYTTVYSGSPGRWGLLDKNGKEVVKPRFSNISFAGKGYFSVNMGATISRESGWVEGGRWGLIDSLGVDIIPPVAENHLFVNDMGLTYPIIDYQMKMFDVIALNQVNNGLRAAQLNNYTDARNWFEKAKQRGNATAYGNLGFLYLQGMGVQKDETKALQYLKQGAERDDAQSMLNLGWYYASQKQDKDEAIKWLLQAEKAGHPQARPMLQQLANMNMNNTPATDSREERMRERQRDN